MTANTLSNKDRAKVASEVTGREFIIYNQHSREWGANKITKVVMTDDDSMEEWGPQQNSAQRCELIEFISRNLNTGATYIGKLIEFTTVIASKDTAALESMVFQMITKGKEDE